MERRPVIVVGSGPAGAATALFLHQRDPALAREVLVLEKAVHPREKVCAGGLIPHTLACLEELEVPLDVPHVVVHGAAVSVPGREVAYAGRNLCCVVRRAGFDASLVRACRARGIEIRERQQVREVVRDGNRIRIETDHAVYRARIVVGADGSGSLVRRRLVQAHSGQMGRAVMADVPVRATQWNGFAAARNDFNFRAVADRLRGYLWAFPCLIEGEPHVNVGAYSIHAEGQYLIDLLQREVERIGGTAARVKAFPIHGYHHRNALSASGAVLVGDAAGVDPLMGEGISYSFEYGRLAAAAIGDAMHSGDMSFAGYRDAVRKSWMGRKLRRLEFATHLFYGPTWPLWFRIAARSRRAQELGIRWYNGVDGWDRASVWAGVKAVWRGKFEAMQ